MVINYGFPKNLDREPTDEENRGLERLTQIFYRRVIAARYGQPYENVVVLLEPTAFNIFNGGKNVEATFDMTVIFNRRFVYPTDNQIKSDIEGIRKEIYTTDFVNFAEPTGGFFSK